MSPWKPQEIRFSTVPSGRLAHTHLVSCYSYFLLTNTRVKRIWTFGGGCCRCVRRHPATSQETGFCWLMDLYPGWLPSGGDQARRPWPHCHGFCKQGEGHGDVKAEVSTVSLHAEERPGWPDIPETRGERRERILFHSLRGNQPWSQPELGLLASGSMGPHTPV